MSLKNATTGAKFEAMENEGDGIAVDNVAETAKTTVTGKPNEAKTATEAGATVAATSTAVAEAPAKTSALAVKSNGAAAVMRNNVFSDTKDAFTIDYDSVPRLKAEQGEIVTADDDVSLGQTVDLQVMSYQESWVASPGDNKADIELLKFADNSTTAEDGTNLDEHVESLKAMGYTEAHKQHRLIVVGELVKVGGEYDGELMEQLVQINLPESGRRSFKSHSLQATFRVAKGKCTAEEAHCMRFTAVKAKSKNDKAYTKTVVGFAD